MKNELITHWKEIMDGTRSRFPKGSFKDLTQVKGLISHIIKYECGMSLEKAKQTIDSKWFSSVKLSGVFTNIFKGSPFRMMRLVFPGKVSEVDMKNTPHHTFRKMENILKAKDWIGTHKKLAQFGMSFAMFCKTQLAALANTQLNEFIQNILDEFVLLDYKSIKARAFHRQSS